MRSACRRGRPESPWGYAGDPDRTAAALGGAYYRTGDVASRDADGYYTCVGRTDDVFKSSDCRISPFERESMPIEHPAVAEAAVVPSPDPVRLAVPKAFIVLRKGHQLSAGLARDILAALANASPRTSRCDKWLRQAGAAPGVSRSAQDHLRKNPTRRAERAGGGTRVGGHQREPGEFWEDDLKLLIRAINGGAVHD